MDKETLPCYIFVISHFASLLPCVIFNRYYCGKRRDHYSQLLRILDASLIEKVEYVSVLQVHTILNASKTWQQMF